MMVTMSFSLRQLVLLALAIALVMAAVVLATMTLTGGADSPTGEILAKGTIPWAI